MTHILKKQINFLFTAGALAACLVSASISGCKKDDDPVNKPPLNDESELITTVILQLTDSANSANTVQAVFDDPDGEGGNAPVRHDTLKLKANTVYFGEVILLDRSKSPADTVSNEVKAEGDAHLFIYKSLGANVLITYRDKDTKGLPVGLQSRWATGEASAGTVEVILKHQPGAKDGTEAPGETDVDVVFRALVQ